MMPAIESVYSTAACRKVRWISSSCLTPHAAEPADYEKIEMSGQIQIMENDHDTSILWKYGKIMLRLMA